MREDVLAESQGELVSILKEEIEAVGRIPFARFMEVVLSHPEYGYYRYVESPAGFAGDFLTAPETHPIFGYTLARQIAECWERLQAPDAFTIREYGAGRGTLAVSVLDELRAHSPAVYAATTYEVSDINARQTAQALVSLGAAGHAEHASAASESAFVGVALANELLDAFPVHRLCVQDGVLREVYVAWRDGWFVDEVGDVSDSLLLNPLQGLSLVEGQRLEVAPAAWSWTQSMCREIERGYAILVDYGYPAQELYDPAHRAEGTLRTYSRHLVSDDPYRRVGHQDLTAHVDFSAVANAASACGCTTLGLTSQAYFFAGLGIEEVLLRLQQEATSAHEYLNARETVLHLMDPRALGRFRVLVLGKEVPSTPALRGLSFAL